MNHIEENLKSKFITSLKNLGFISTDIVSGTMGEGYEVFQGNDHLLIRVRKGREKIFVELSSKALEEEEWFGIAIVMQALNLSKEDSSVIRSEHIGFINEEITAIRNFLSPHELAESKKLLNRLENERADRMWS